MEPRKKEVPFSHANTGGTMKEVIEFAGNGLMFFFDIYGCWKREQSYRYCPVGTHPGKDSKTGTKTRNVYQKEQQGCCGQIVNYSVNGYVQLEGFYKTFYRGILAREVEITDPKITFGLIGELASLATRIISISIDYAMPKNQSHQRLDLGKGRRNSFCNNNDITNRKAFGLSVIDISAINKDVSFESTECLFDSNIEFLTYYKSFGNMLQPDLMRDNCAVSQKSKFELFTSSREAA